MSPLTESYFDLLCAWQPRQREAAFSGITHYVNDSSSDAWRREMLAIETEGERTPAQTEPHPAVMDEATPALLRKQAA